MISNRRNTAGLHRSIISGKLADKAKPMQIQVYKFCFVWQGSLAVLGAIPFLVQWLPRLEARRI